MKKIIITLILSMLFLAQTAYSLDLQSAKGQGLLGETASGYLGVVKSATPETSALMQSINAKRKQKYIEIATRNKTSLQTIEKLAGEKAMAKSKPGSYINKGSGWQKK
ncbi:MAG TPA: DUF1318 domain-containing protein [Gammaproteobacteria bacterium]|nr:DUF1318 domain-containing protein [Gammaproteobacteria bacterium]